MNLNLQKRHNTRKIFKQFLLVGFVLAAYQTISPDQHQQVALSDSVLSAQLSTDVQHNPQDATNSDSVNVSIAFDFNIDLGSRLNRALRRVLSR